MNATEVLPDKINDYYIVCLLSGLFAMTAVAISIMILIVIWRTKPRLHTVRHLLTCNTCIASIFYCIIQSNNYVFLIFLPWETSDMGCRWRAYFAYVTLCGVAYSFLIQAISRLFISVFSTKYRCLITFKVHYILICVQWFVSIVIPLPAIITQDVIFRPNALCWVPLTKIIHVSITYTAYYVIPVLSICMIYLFIYYRLKNGTNRAQIFVKVINNDKRDLEVLRNIVILLGIYLAGGIPTLLFIVTSNTILYLGGIVTISLAVAIEKVCTILLDRELRQVIKMLILKTRRITPIDNTHTIARYQENVTHIQGSIVQLPVFKKNISMQLA